MAEDDNNRPGTPLILAPEPAWFSEALAVKPEERMVMVEECPIRYLRWGDPTKPGLLLVHGNAAHAWWWAFIAPFLATDYHVVAMNLSGMGDSGWRQSYHMELFAHEMIEVAEHAGFYAVDRPPVVVGHSFGGFCSILTGSMFGDQLAGVVLVDSPINPPERPHRGPPDRETRPHNIYPTFEAAMARFRLAPPQQCDNDYLVRYVAERSLHQVDGGWTWKFDPQIWRRFSIGDLAARLKEISCRVAVFRGELSDLMPHDVGAYMFELLNRNAPVVEIPQARHHVMLDQPLAFIAALRALLADWEHSMPNRRRLTRP
jgi:pimeloyl-ACP methyl ester carboxylesterase